MRTNKEIANIAQGIYKEATATLANIAKVKESQVNQIIGKGADEGFETVQSVIGAVEDVLKVPEVDGVGLPAYLSKFTYEEGDFSKITITIRTKLKSEYKYRRDTVVAVDKDFVTNVGKAYLDSLYDMFYIEEAIANVNSLNEKIKSILEENDIPFGFRFAVDMDTSAVILSINNDEVVFNTNLSKAHDIASLSIFRGGDEYEDYVCKEATEKFVTSLKAIQTPVQLIKGNIELIKEITGVSTKKRASKLIRGSYHRQAKYLGAVKSGVGYFEETVKVNNEDVDIFGLVAKAEDGTISVVLNPFDVKSLFNVDFDLLGAVKEQLAS